jgi:L-asparaginase II
MGRAPGATGHRRGMSETANDNPILVEVVRGALIESAHRGAVAVADSDGRVLLALGDVERPVFPRSAVKAFQAIPLIESGAADAFALDAAELAVACASHGGEVIHLEAVRSLLGKAGVDETLLACGAHWPLSETAQREIARAGSSPRPIHNNCSGKHAGMLATAVQLGVRLQGYERPDHPVQIEIARVISELCGVRLEAGWMGVDGCSVPTYAVPLAALATGFARLGAPAGLPARRQEAARRLTQACFEKPALVAGKGRFDTIAMGGLAPAVFCKGGAEGVHCAALPELGLGIALKVDDGAKRGAEAAMGHLFAALVPGADAALADFLDGDVRNWKGQRAGGIRASAGLAEAVAALVACHHSAPNRMLR